MRRRATLFTLVPLLLIAACSDDDDSADTTTAPVDSGSEGSESDAPATSAPTTEPAPTAGSTAPSSSAPSSSAPSSSAPSGDGGVVAGEPFPEDRCAANQEAGTISYLTGFDFAAAASIMEVILADELGYYDELCLDVEITPSFSTANYPLVASNDAQFSSAGSFTEVVNFADINEAELVALSVDGHTAIDVLMVHPEVAGSLAEIEGTTIGVKGAIPPAIAAMLQGEAGLIEGDDYSTVLLEGFDVTAHWELPDLSGIPGWRSNEPGALSRAGLEFELYDPSDYGIPGSFGLIYTNAAFLEEHPTAAEDFMRATMRALADAIADPATAAAVAVERINGNGNPNFLSPEGEAFRWETDAAAIVSSTPEGSDFGVPIGADLQAELDAYAEIGYFGDAGTPSAEGRYHPDLVAGLYQDGTVVWPAAG